MARPPESTARQAFTLCNFHGLFIYAIGGLIQQPGEVIDSQGNRGKEETLFLTNVDRYDIRENKWSPAPPLREARYNLSSCTLGGMIYAICGISQTNGHLNTIERLKVSFQRQASSKRKWQTIRF